MLIIAFKFSFVCVDGEDLLSQIDWKHGKFYEAGSPIEEKHIEEQLNTVKGYTVTPIYFVITSSLKEEGNMYVKLDSNISDSIIRFYGNNHPHSPNYKLNVNGIEVERCSNLNNCEKLDLCVLAKSDKVIKEKIIYMSWEIRNKHNNRHHVTLQFHYKDQIIICRDPDAIEVGKIVLEEKQSQQVRSKSLDYKYTTQMTSASVTIPQINSAVAVYVTSCWNCKFVFKLSCNGTLSENQTNNNYSSSQLIKFSGNATLGYNYYGIPKWQKIILQKSTKEQDCLLNVTAMLEEDNSNTNNFWAIALIDPNETDLSTTATKTTKLPPTKLPPTKPPPTKPLPTPCTCDGWKILCYCCVSFVGGLFITCVCKYYFQKLIRTFENLLLG